MTRDDIIRMAREVGAEFYADTLLISGKDAHDFIERFARLIAAAEREACLACYSPDDTATDLADKIRARSQS